MGPAFGNDWLRNHYFLSMKFEYLIKTDCVACLGVIKEFIKKISGVLDVELDSATGKIIIEYKGEFSREELAKVIKEKTGYELTNE